jgi:2-methylcitrate dehydratase PrpD
MSIKGSLEQALAEHVAGVRYEDLPRATVERTKALVLDTIGAILAGREAEGCQEVNDLVMRWGGAGEARVLTSGARVPAHNAALVNSMMGRALELVEVHEQALLQSTATMVPVALAAAEVTGKLAGSEFLACVALGTDVAARLSLAPVLHTGENRRPMWHTSQTGVMGGALITGRIYGFSASELRNTLGIAYSQCAGNQQGLIEGTLMVRVQQGLTASAALVSAALHQIGITGPLQALEGASGYFNAFHGGEYDRDVIVAGLGREYQSDRVSIKPYPCCKLTHTFIAAMLQARASQDIDISRVSRIVATVNNHASYDVICLPETSSERRALLSGDRAAVNGQFSLAYILAATLVRGHISLSDFTPQSLSDPVVLDLMDKVVTVADEDEAAAPTFPTPGVVDIYLEGAHEPIRGRASYAKGHPSDPMTFDEVTAKFTGVMATVADQYPSEAAERIVAAVAEIEESPNVVDLIDLITGLT